MNYGNKIGRGDNGRGDQREADYTNEDNRKGNYSGYKE